MGASGKGKDKDGKTTTKRRPGRTATSCAECRRLKLRCDRQVPCGKCVSRGCAAICPDGSLTAGKGNRLVLANTEQLHDRIEQLCSRIRELESALRSTQAQLSAEDHPLLRSELLQLKSPHVVYTNDGPAPPMSSNSSGSDTHPFRSDNDASPKTKVEDENLIDAFGTLSIRENGETQFLGQTARSEYLIRALAKPQKNTAPVPGTRLSQKIINGAHFCRDDSEPSCGSSISPERDTRDLGKEVFSLLPPLSEAIRLCELYLEYGKYMYTPLPRIELFDEILTCIYRSDSFDALGCYHSLSLIFIVFALASLFDPDLPSCSIQAQEYFYLSKAALNFNPPFSHTTLKSVWCMIHVAQFLEFSDWEAMGSTAGWAYVGHAVRMGTSIGFHLNSSRWKLPDDIQQRQYRLFWTVFTTDTWSSFYYGRPPSISRAYIDCPLPRDTEEFINSDGERETGFHYWGWQFTAFIQTIMEETFGSSRPTYSSIIEFDRKIRDFPVPFNLIIKCGVLESKPELYMQRLIVMSYKENILMHLHRAYFAQALQDSPNDLTTHKYVASVIATYRSAWRLSKAMQIAWKNVPFLLARYHMAWSQVLSSAIVMCILVTRAPNSKMTKSSVEELDGMSSLFEEAAPTSRSAANILDTMRNLRRKAREVIDSTTSVDGTNSSNDSSPAESYTTTSQSGFKPLPAEYSPLSCAASFTNTDDLEKTQGISLSTFELDRLSGRTHLISTCKSSKSATSSQRPASSHNSSDKASNAHPSPESQTSLPAFTSWIQEENLSSPQQYAPAQNLHPTIAQDIRNIEMDVDMNLGGVEFHFFDPPAGFEQSFGASPQLAAGQNISQQGDASLRYATTTAGLGNQDLATESRYVEMPDHFGVTPMVNEDIMGDMSSMGGSGTGVFGNSMFSPLPSTGAFSALGHPQTNAHLPFGAPILDASWQSFVEQLGF
ncbi:fungal-specific transcription factor domain-containing protein [Lentinula aciculospora]|uniref:Fungal-specific transcription factor domain-containing protein n=1 Tax=Lentinula aciculospora TaxID=153920 RepID=A0A9W8ZZN8_9AGAR|nr:fungal-specific transcription factor domain-containing protein [Lentinula aciculospora]